MIEELKVKQRVRLSLLKKMYELSQGDIHKFVNGGALAASCGITDESLFKTSIDYLEAQYLLETKRVYKGMPALLRIKHEGILEVEAAFAMPDKASSNFLPINVLYVGQMVGSTIQQGTVGSTQNSTTSITNDATAQLVKFVDAATELLKTVDKNSETWREVKAEVETLRSQSASPNPKQSIIKECLESIGRLCEGAAAGAVGTQLATYIPVLLALF